MTKRLSLAEDAYEALRRLKRPGESFSDLALRVARQATQVQAFERTGEAPVWTDEEARALKRSILRARDESRAPRVGPS